MKLKCIIIDDEKPTIDHLIRYIKKVPFLEVIATFTDPTEAIKALENKAFKVDFAFVDIIMPNAEIDGIDLIQIVGSRISYILTTSYPQYAVQGFNHQVVDFLHKPYSFERFMQAINKVKEKHQPIESNFLFVKKSKKNDLIIKIPISGIYWIESDRNYISIFTIDERITIVSTIKDIEAKLPAHLFSRVHKSYIVSNEKIELISNNQITLKKTNIEKVIPIGESYKDSFLANIKDNYL